MLSYPNETSRSEGQTQVVPSPILAILKFPRISDVRFATVNPLTIVSG
ncbi:hypothetical protein Salmuc_01844 [Salipiger mucosus DSM 16094]|uniref:Uncharacterized protein n=1 Tax=Salipiger mucosus DSM 16094 TaxID=1123237 RepID=S9SCW6_9RHOB|nr:hypothetical protein Salmuc_01844 [Salipiger mucosus DSM 16094]